MSRTLPQGHQILIAASLVAAVLGSIHAFSIFLEPLESVFAASRSTVSLTYSFGLVFLTGAVLLGPAIYIRLRPATIYICVAFIGAAGAAIAGMASNIGLVWIGYGAIFGVANGIGYGFGLQLAARANPEFAGFAMGVVTAAYAFGAVVAPYGFQVAMASGGFRTAMMALAAAIFLAGLIAAVLAARSKASYSDMQTAAANARLPIDQLAWMWIAYGTAVAAGLMAIGHAAGIAVAAGFTAWVAPAVLAGFNLIGSLLSGWLADRISHRTILVILPLISALSLATLIAFPQLTLISLGLVGFAYGGTIAAYPAAISRQFPGDDGPRAYGRIFTAWGAAGLLAPWVAGRIFELTGDYDTALYFASALALISALLAGKIVSSR